MDKNTVLKVSVISIVAAISALTIIILLIRPLTYNEIISLSEARMEGVRDINYSYSLGVGYEDLRGAFALTGTANYTKTIGLPDWDYSIVNESGTVYDLSPEELLGLLKIAEGKYISILPAGNGCYEVEAFIYNMTKAEKHLHGYDIMQLAACLDKVTGYPLQYRVVVSNTLTGRSGMALYNIGVLI